MAVRFQPQLKESNWDNPNSANHMKCAFAHCVQLSVTSDAAMILCGKP